MSKFEVHIPATDGNGFNVTLKVGADNWMSALKAGLQKLGEQGTISQNVMVDIQEDNSIHVTEAASGRVFRIRELTEEEAAKAQVKRPSQIRPAVAPTRAEVKTEPGLPAVKRPDDGKTQPIPIPKSELEITRKGGDPLKMPSPDLNKTAPDLNKTLPGHIPSAPPRNATPAPRVQKGSARLELKDVEELVQPIRMPTGNIGRAKSSPNIAKSQRQETEDILADIFLRVVDLSSKKDIEEAMEFVLDLVMEKVPCEAGSVLRADGATGDLSFVAARGPKAKEILKANIIVPAGTGIAGFCAAEGVSVAVSDVEKDPRFYAEVGEKVDYETKSLLCAPMMTHGRSFGCLQLINRKQGPAFAEHEVGVLSYIAHQAALYLNDRG
jgi:hypothetical protein